jgi:hypothetical protein
MMNSFGVLNWLQFLTINIKCIKDTSKILKLQEMENCKLWMRSMNTNTKVSF